MNLDQYSLREKKHARTKVMLLNAFIERLKTTRFENISISEVCKSVEVSEGTFFNYFFEKLDVIEYYISLITTKEVWDINNKFPQGNYIKKINMIFEAFAAKFEITPNVFYEILSVLIAETEDGPKRIPIPALEKYFAFGDCPGFVDAQAVTIKDFFMDCLQQAVKHGDLPADTNVEEVMFSLHTIMVGTILTVRSEHITNNKVNYHFQRQLNLIWSQLNHKIIGS